MKPRLLLVLAPAEDKRRELASVLGKARRDHRDYIVHAEYFDPVQESSFRFRYFDTRIAEVRRGHFQIVVMLGSVSNEQVSKLLKSIPKATRVGNCADLGSDLDVDTFMLTGAQNKVTNAAQGEP